MKEGGIFRDHPTSRRGDLRRYECVVVHEDVSRRYEMYRFRVADRRCYCCDFQSICELRDLRHADVRCAQRSGRRDEGDAAHVSLARRRLLHAIRAVDVVLAGSKKAWWLACGVSSASGAVLRGAAWSWRSMMTAAVRAWAVKSTTPRNKLQIFQC